MEIFDIFKLVLGLVVGMFFLVFMLKFTDIYTGFQGQAQEISQLKALKKAVEDVYIYDVPVKVSLSSIPAAQQPGFLSKSKGVSIDDIIFLFRPGKDLVAYKSQLEKGPWKINWVGIFPSTKIAFNPLEYAEEAYSTMFGLASMLPQSEDPPVKIGFCNGKTLFNSETKNRFTSIIKPIIKSPQNLNFTICDIESEGILKVIIYNPEASFISGMQLKPITGSTGFAVLPDGKSFYYRDMLDALALLIGGEEYYNYKNIRELETLSLAAKQEAKRAALLKARFLDAKYKSIECSAAYNILQAKLGEASAEMDGALASNEFNNQQEAELISQMLEDIKATYGDLEATGC